MFFPSVAGTGFLCDEVSYDASDSGENGNKE
jgi:hypothetical protein